MSATLPAPSRAGAGRTPRDVLFLASLALLVILGALARIGASLGELWLDELWSLGLVSPLGSAAQVFTAIHHENNHHLVSLWIWLCGADAPWWAYRVPSVAAGVLAVLAGIRIGLRQSRATALFAALLLSLSYLVVFYSSEARGYAIACGMALLAYDSMELYLRAGRWRHAAGYGAAAVAGMLGNLSFASVLLALGAWSVAALLPRGRRAAVELLRLHAAPAAALAAVWLVDLRLMQAGDGPRIALRRVLGETMAYASGLPGDSTVGQGLLVVAVVFILWQVSRLARGRDPRSAFFAVGLLIAPAGLLAATGRVYLYPRYFVVDVCVLYLLVALALGAAWKRWPRWPRWLAGTALAAWVAANGLLTVDLWRTGRGHYREALQFVADQMPAGPARIGSTQDFRSSLLLGYYRRYLPPERRPVVVPLAAVPRDRPEWLLTTFSPYESPTLPDRLALAPDAVYVRVKEYPTARLSGFEAGVYRLSAPAPAPGPAPFASPLAVP